MYYTLNGVNRKKIFMLKISLLHHFLCTFLMLSNREERQ